MGVMIFGVPTSESSVYTFSLRESGVFAVSGVLSSSD